MQVKPRLIVLTATTGFIVTLQNCAHLRVSTLNKFNNMPYVRRNCDSNEVGLPYESYGIETLINSYPTIQYMYTIEVRAFSKL